MRDVLSGLAMDGRAATTHRVVGRANLPVSRGVAGGSAGASPSRNERPVCACAYLAVKHAEATELGSHTLADEVARLVEAY